MRFALEMDHRHDPAGPVLMNGHFLLGNPDSDDDGLANQSLTKGDKDGSSQHYS
jgi:hypothetical protein